jgi:hypothetical protein
MPRSYYAICFALLLTGCAYPTSMVEQGASNGSVYFPKVGAGTRVILDGADAGEAASYDGKKSVLEVVPGPHRIALRQGSALLYERQIYVGTASKIAIEGP